jgi:hypothetical protein
MAASQSKASYFTGVLQFALDFSLQEVFMRVFPLALILVLIPFVLYSQTQPSQPSPLPQGTPSWQRPPSPPGRAIFNFADGKQITIDYSRPSMRGRKIMGELVPYGFVWRTGANSATSFITQTELDFAGSRVPAGKYTLYTIPGEHIWTIIINRQTGQWGTIYNGDMDLVRVNVQPVQLMQPVDQFTIFFQNRGPMAGTLKLEWEKTSVPIEFSEVEQK